MVSEIDEHYRWYREGAGMRMIEAERRELGAILPKLYGYHLALLGDTELTSLISSSLIKHQFVINPLIGSDINHSQGLQGALDALPLRNDSIDVVVLSHTLEQSRDPHEVLRETHRILIPEGHILITGFNPLSMWGAWYAAKQMGTAHQGKMLSLNRVKDWLKLLNFQIISGKMFYFRPPLKGISLHQKLKFMEHWGEKFWPYFGGAYVILAVKRVIPLTPIRAKFKPEKPIWRPVEGLPKPTTTVQKIKINVK